MKTAVRTRRIAIIGNPNTGKTTIFNQLTGFNARVGNYAGVTVERKVAPLKGFANSAVLIDLPGIYSIAARSPDEMVAVDVLLGNRAEEPDPPDAVLLVVDASNLDRNLFLATQVMDAGLPCAIILNMIDVAAKNGVTIDHKLLGTRLNLPVFPVIGPSGIGLDAVRTWLKSEESASAGAETVVFPEAFEAALDRLSHAVADMNLSRADTSPFLLRRALLESGGMAEKRLRNRGGEPAAIALRMVREEVEAAGHKVLSLEARTRYTAIGKLLDGVRTAPEEHRNTTSDRIDSVLLHPIWGSLVFVALMLIVFQAIFAWSAPLMGVIEGFFEGLATIVAAALPEGPFAGFVTNGVIAGVGGVVIFLPQILFLFLFISILEDCGYMARAAFLADRLFSRLGLSGRSFIPLLSSFACAIPGVMATRTISDSRDRLTTMLVAPLMSCSARLPVYTLMIAAFVPSTVVAGIFGLQGVVLFLMYLVGPSVAVFMALMLRKTVLKGPKPTFLMELPPYRMPVFRVVASRLVERAGAFLLRAGTVILAVSVIVWAAGNYPKSPEAESRIRTEYTTLIADANPADHADLEARMEHAVASAQLSGSLLGTSGRLIEPLVTPLGWDWRIGMAVIASFPAREVVVSTLAIIFEAGPDDEGDLQSRLQGAVRADGSPLFTFPVACAIMVFFALCAQCVATLAVIRRESNGWRWPLFAFAYMTALAWIGAFITYHALTFILAA